MNNYSKLLFIILFTVFHTNAIAKRPTLEKKIDNIGNQRVLFINSNKNEINLKDLSKKIDSLKKQGYFNLEILQKVKTDSLKYKVTIDLNQKFENIYIYSESRMINFKGKDAKIIEGKKHYSIKINELESFLTRSSKDIANKGYPFNKVQLNNIKDFDNTNLYASINVKLNDKRKSDKVVIKGYENFPKAFLKHYLKYSNKDDFNFDVIKNKSEEINKLGFVSQIKDPEILFKKDSTIIYLYLEKVKNNSFDGFIGFATNEENEKLEINGYMDIRLHNTLNYGEKINVNYRSTSDNNRFLKTNITTPYIFNTALGLELDLNLTKKDSTYIKDEQSVGLNFLIKNKHNLSFHLSTLNSTSSLETTNELIKDYKSNFKKIKYNFKKVNINNKLIPVKFLTSIELSTGKRKDNLETKTQNRYFIKTFNNFNITKSSSIYLNLEAYGSNSSNYYLNEMLLFGGIYSIRRFEENSIATNKLSLINTEYRIKLNNDIYINTIFDTAYYENTLANIRDNIYGVGFGLNINTNSGVFRLNYANGIKKGQDIDLKLSKIHVSFSNIF